MNFLIIYLIFAMINPLVTAIWSARRKMFQTYHKEGSRIAQMEKVRHTRYALFNKVCTFKTCKKCQILTEVGDFGRKMEHEIKMA